MFNYFVSLAAIIIVISYIVSIAKKNALLKGIRSRWHHHFETLQFSSQEFYATLQEVLKQHEIPGIYFSRTVFPQAGLLSPQREYLVVRRADYTFYICAAPFGTGFFISWWLRESPDIITRIITRISIVLSAKTYYQLDTETMFKESVHHGVLEAIDKITNAKGLRGLTELERTFGDLDK